MGTEIVIEDPVGLPEAICGDLERAGTGNVQMSYDEGRDIVTIWVNSSNAGKWLYEWLESTMDHYQTEYPWGAEMEYKSAREMRDRVYQEFVEGEL